MLVNEITHKDDDGSIGYIESVFDSSNILLSTYFPKTETIYISFKRGHTYKYLNFNHELYEEFMNADSQGKFFNEKIKNNENLLYENVFKLFESEINEAKKIIDEWKKNNQQLKS